MWNKLTYGIKKNFGKLIRSIAFYPALIGLLFLVLAILMLMLDFSSAGKMLKSDMQWLKLKDSSTARSILSSITAGIISLTVFSFSMVMIVLNQAASQMSNRILDKLIGNMFQQIVLGIYIGTIVYSLFLLSSIRDIDAGIYIPALSIYLLMAITIFDIFLFIYFLHYITQSVKYEIIIHRIFRETKTAMEKNCFLKEENMLPIPNEKLFPIHAASSGIYENFDKKKLLAFCEKNACRIHILFTPGSFVLKDIPLLQINKIISPEEKKEILKSINLQLSETISGNYIYGLQQLTEVAVKALSPGINDPGTATVSLRSIIVLLSYRLLHFPSFIIASPSGEPSIITQVPNFQHIFNSTILPIWDYGKNDRIMQQEMKNALLQLQKISDHQSIRQLLHQMEAILAV